MPPGQSGDTSSSLAVNVPRPSCSENRRATYIVNQVGRSGKWKYQDGKLVMRLQPSRRERDEGTRKSSEKTTITLPIVSDCQYLIFHSQGRTSKDGKAGAGVAMRLSAHWEQHALCLPDARHGKGQLRAQLKALHYAILLGLSVIRKGARHKHLLVYSDAFEIAQWPSAMKKDKDRESWVHWIESCQVPSVYRIPNPEDENNFTARDAYLSPDIDDLVREVLALIVGIKRVYSVVVGVALVHPECYSIGNRRAQRCAEIARESRVSGIARSWARLAYIEPKDKRRPGTERKLAELRNVKFDAIDMNAPVRLQ